MELDPLQEAVFRASEYGGGEPMVITVPQDVGIDFIVHGPDHAFAWWPK